METDRVAAVSEFDTLPDIWVEHPSKSLQDIFESKVDVEGVCEYHIVPPQRQDVSIRYTYTSSVSISGDHTPFSRPDDSNRAKRVEHNERLRDRPHSLSSCPRFLRLPIFLQR